MQPIEFRGKAIETGKWVFGYYYANKPFTELRHYIKLFEKEKNVVAYEVDPKTVTQYTGINDKKGEKLFGGDITQYGVVEWLKGCWCINGDRLLSDFGAIEKKGNIFENPELAR